MSPPEITPDELTSDDCNLCEGKGEIDATDLDKAGSVGCPRCISADLEMVQTQLDEAMLKLRTTRDALFAITRLPTGSKGAYGKFKAAQDRAKEALGL